MVVDLEKSMRAPSWVGSSWVNERGWSSPVSGRDKFGIVEEGLIGLCWTGTTGERESASVVGGVRLSAIIIVETRFG